MALFDRFGKTTETPEAPGGSVYEFRTEVQLPAEVTLEVLVHATHGALETLKATLRERWAEDYPAVWALVQARLGGGA